MRTLLLVTLLILLSRDCTAQITLPKPAQSGDVSVESALASRRSLRQFSDSAVTLQQLSQLLWAAQGLTSSRGNRTAPSAGGLYPLEVYLVVENVSGLAAGTYRYHPKGHRLSLVSQGHDIQAVSYTHLTLPTSFLV